MVATDVPFLAGETPGDWPPSDCHARPSSSVGDGRGCSVTGDILRQLFHRLSERPRTGDDVAFFALPVPGAGGHMVSLSAAGRPGLLLRPASGGPRPQSIHLTGLNAVFGVTCKVAQGDLAPQDCQISVLECTAGAEALPLFAEFGGFVSAFARASAVDGKCSIGCCRFRSHFFCN